MDRQTKRLIEKYVLRDYPSGGYCFNITYPEISLNKETSIFIAERLSSYALYWSSSKKQIFNFLDTIPPERILFNSITLAELINEIYPEDN